MIENSALEKLNKKIDELPVKNETVQEIKTEIAELISSVNSKSAELILKHLNSKLDVINSNSSAVKNYTDDFVKAMAKTLETLSNKNIDRVPDKLKEYLLEIVGKIENLKTSLSNPSVMADTDVNQLKSLKQELNYFQNEIELTFSKELNEVNENVEKIILDIKNRLETFQDNLDRKFSKYLTDILKDIKQSKTDVVNKISTDIKNLGETSELLNKKLIKQIIESTAFESQNVISELSEIKKVSAKSKELDKAKKESAEILKNELSVLKNNLIGQIRDVLNKISVQDEIKFLCEDAVMSIKKGNTEFGVLRKHLKDLKIGDEKQEIRFKELLNIIDELKSYDLPDSIDKIDMIYTNLSMLNNWANSSDVISQGLGEFYQDFELTSDKVDIIYENLTFINEWVKTLDKFAKDIDEILISCRGESDLPEKIDDIHKNINAVKEWSKKADALALQVKALSVQISETETSVNAQNLAEIKLLFNEMNNSLSDINKNISEAKSNISEVNTNISDVKNSITEVNTNVSDVKNSITEVNTNISDVKNNISEVNTNVSDLKNDISDVTSCMSYISCGISDANINISAANTNISDMKSEISDLNKNMSVINTNITAVNSNISDMNNDISDMNAKTNKLIIESDKSTTILTQHIRDLENVINLFAKKSDANTDTLKDWNEQTEKLSLMVETLSGYVNTKNFNEFKQLFNSMTDKISEMTDKISDMNTRTNKMIIESDKSNDVLYRHLQDLQSLINSFKEKSENLGIENLNQKIDELKEFTIKNSGFENIVKKSFINLAEWIDMAGTAINSIKTDIANLSENTENRFMEIETVISTPAPENPLISQILQQLNNISEVISIPPKENPDIPDILKKLNTISDKINAPKKDSPLIPHILQQLNNILDAISTQPQENPAFPRILQQLQNISEYINDKKIREESEAENKANLTRIQKAEYNDIKNLLEDIASKIQNHTEQTEESKKIDLLSERIENLENKINSFEKYMVKLINYIEED